MPLIPWKPFDDFDRFFSDDDWLLPVVSRFPSGPAMNVYETEKDVVAEVNLPGIDPAKIDVSVRDRILRVSGSSEEETKEEKKGYYRHEIRKGSFDRAVRLPSAVKEDDIDATYEKGVLKIIMPKSEQETKEKKIKIKTKD